MEELLIDEKKYVSSRRAAQITGYAKDYISQLCREGRVPARLIGRSWYVLETAIQDHRFGTVNTKPEEVVHSAPPASGPLQEGEPTNGITVSSAPVQFSKWESPNYKSATEEFLPSVNRLRQKTDSDIHEQVSTEELNVTGHLEDSWREWFDHIADTATDVHVVMDVDMEKIEDTNKEKQLEDAEIDEKNEDQKEVSVPIHTVYELPPETFTSDSRVEVRHPSEESRTSRQPMFRPKKVTVRIVQITSAVIATVALAVAVIGSGYLDTFIISNSQASVLTGASIYSK
jgi:hypothetical protein